MKKFSILITSIIFFVSFSISTYAIPSNPQEAYDEGYASGWDDAVDEHSSDYETGYEEAAEQFDSYYEDGYENGYDEAEFNYTNELDRLNYELEEKDEELKKLKTDSSSLTIIIVLAFLLFCAVSDIISKKKECEKLKEEIKNYDDIQDIKTRIRNHIAKKLNKSEQNIHEYEIEDFFKHAIDTQIDKFEEPKNFFCFSNLFNDFVNKKLDKESKYFKNYFKNTNFLNYSYKNNKSYLLTIQTDDNDIVKSVCVDCNKAIVSDDDFETLYYSVIHILEKIIILDKEILIFKYLKHSNSLCLYYEDFFEEYKGKHINTDSYYIKHFSEYNNYIYRLNLGINSFSILVDDEKKIRSITLYSERLRFSKNFNYNRYLEYVRTKIDTIIK